MTSLFIHSVIQCGLQVVVAMNCHDLEDDDDQPKLKGSGVVLTLVCEYPRDPKEFFEDFSNQS